ncbi:MAG: hypothetical protein M3R25_03530 [Bacteroidota bacterium]|nr:hypothetical protein [Bacteroidota bacterium]
MRENERWAGGNQESSRDHDRGGYNQRRDDDRGGMVNEEMMIVIAVATINEEKTIVGVEAEKKVVMMK